MIITKHRQNDAKTLKILNSEGIFDLDWFRHGEEIHLWQKRETGSVSYLLQTMRDLDETSAVCLVTGADHMTTVSHGNSDTNWPQELCDLQLTLK